MSAVVRLDERERATLCLGLDALQLLLTGQDLPREFVSFADRFGFSHQVSALMAKLDDGLPEPPPGVTPPVVAKVVRFADYVRGRRADKAKPRVAGSVRRMLPLR
jgi:hypothetical protein